MAMMRGYCTNCNKNDEYRRIFEVNSDAKVCYCPHCGKKYRPKVAIFNYDHRITKYIKRARFFLRNVGNPKYSYQLYAYVLELEPTNKSAKLGRLLSLSYLSTLRRNRFTEVIQLLEITREDVKGQYFNKRYFDFLVALNHSVDNYMIRVKRKLQNHDCFYDVDCLKLYFKHLRDAIALKRVIAGEFSSINEKQSAMAVFDSIKAMELAYNNVNYTVDGHDHYFTNFTKSGDLLITDGKKPIAPKAIRKQYSLEKTNKKTKIIRDGVFSMNSFRIFLVYEKCYIYAIILGVISIASLITFFANSNNSLDPLFLTLFIVLTVLSISFIVLRLLLSAVLKKPKY